jgi:hypothetical protein
MKTGFFKITIYFHEFLGVEMNNLWSAYGSKSNFLPFFSQPIIELPVKPNKHVAGSPTFLPTIVK